MAFRSKLPDVGTTIFTVISRRAQQAGALNIGQGFPDFPMDPALAALVGEAIAAGRNQYAHGDGVPELRAAIAAKLQLSYGIAVDPIDEITVTCGGTEGLFSTIATVVGPGDEVLVFDPAYDAYEPAIRLAGGVCVRLPLHPPAFRIDWERVRAALTPRTRLVVLNNPHNPACVMHPREDLDQLAALLRNRECYVMADEVYEHVLCEGRQHASVLTHPELRARSFAIFSFGKTLHVTGWRVGYCVAAPELTREFRKVHQFNTFSITTPLQVAIARYLEQDAACWQGLPEFFQRKRERFLAGIAGSGFLPVPAQGTYFQLLDFAPLAQRAGLAESDVEFAERMIRDGGVAPIPLSPFYRERPHMTLLRFCIAKREETLDLAASKLQAFAATLRA